MNWRQSPQAFVRALKAPNDPPHPEHPFKIEIAKSGWDDVEFAVPNKALLVLEWILATFKSKLAQQVIVDVRYWSLLADVLGQTTVKSQITLLLNRIPFTPIVSSFLANLHRPCDPELLESVRRSISVLWPLGVHRSNADVLGECWGALLAAIVRIGGALEGDSCQRIGMIVTDSYKLALGNSFNKKKLNQTFLSTHLHSWFQAIHTPTLLSESIYTAGIETLFNLDVLRSSPIDSLFQVLVALPTESYIVLSLPRLYASYIHSIRRYRSTLFPSSGIENAAMKFYSKVNKLLVRYQARQEEVWEARVGLVGVVEGEKVFKPGEVRVVGGKRKRGDDEDNGETEGEGQLKEGIELALDVLRDQSSPKTTKASITYLTTLTKIDYETLISPSLAKILHVLLLSSTEASEFLGLVVEYYSRTRMVPSYIDALVSCFSHLDFVEDSRDVYQAVHTSSVLGKAHLGALEKAVRGFVTPGQVLGVDEGLRDVLKGMDGEGEGGETKDEGNGKEKNKRRKSSSHSQERQDSRTKEIRAIRLSLLSALARTILPCLPLRSLPMNEREVVVGVIEEIGAAVLGGVETFFRVGKKHKRGGKKGVREWDSQVHCVAFLKLWYSLPSSPVTTSSQLDDELREGMLSFISRLDSDDEGLHELSVEIFRALLLSSSPNQTNSKALIDAILAYISPLATQPVSWSGLSCDLDASGGGRCRAALAVFWVVCERFLSVFEKLASLEQLVKFVGVLMGVGRSVGGVEEEGEEGRGGGVNPRLVFLRALRSAEFWEMGNLRIALMSHISTTLAPLTSPSLSLLSLLSSLSKPRLKDVPDGSILDRAYAMYAFLLYVPIEYITKSSRTEFVRCALVLDVLSALRSKGKGKEGFGRGGQGVKREVTVSRVFLGRVFGWLGVVDYPAVGQMTEYLVDSSSTFRPCEGDEEFRSATLDLVDMHFLSLIRSAEKGPEGENSLSSLIQVLQRVAERIPTTSNDVSHLALLHLIDTLTTSFNADKFTPGVRDALSALLNVLSSSVRPKILSMTMSNITDHQFALDAWCRVLAFGIWLPSVNVPPQYGPSIVRKILSAVKNAEIEGEHVKDVCASSLAILLQEIRYAHQVDREKNLGTIVATYLAFSRISGSQGTAKLDSYIAKASRLLSVADFAYMLDLIAESLSTGVHSEDDLTVLIHLSSTLLREAPEGTLKVTQNHFSQTLSVFVNYPVFYGGPASLRVAALGFVAQQCSDRPAAIRSQDVGSVWSLLARFLAGSKKHDEESNPAIFHHIVSILSALVRLRRDLILSTLPHLGTTLSHMLMLTRNLRPQLGAKQSKQVTDTLPLWINVSRPLGGDESKALARLLESLTTKSVVRTHGSGPDTQKAESLSRPFSKHAAYVLKAYIDAMNDPLCFMPSEIRKDLQPGLFSLCEMMSEHNRDAMMVSAFDAGGKTTMKTLWKEYEKQRYVGKG
ncbi:hypothetical protein JAAARDRAFT_60187 [Jaapia argillacea MUCL 33604]|uniref:Nucleolar 27S pre-rRNA processing Urb2/Npa2 C-terminal domain-containing protein n=1 Tax=Jaapia argillacea MUCL 33604 TaxID=933084 RepID=A0A067PTW0_9AGAM|nr:hypothetical protein JAAARDRAFT_60187 [Jaapia argillacea MUCL 33604]